jgi:regulator of RNase E activity RraA
VNPGDAILADENGVLVLRANQIEEAADVAIRMQTEEKTLFARLDAGEKLPDISEATKRVLAKMVQG